MTKAVFSAIEQEAMPKLRIKQVVSSVGKLEKHVLTLKGLGLNKVNRIVELNDTPSIRGMINKVKHLVVVL